MATSIFIRPQQGIQIVTAPVRFANGSGSAPGISFAGNSFDGFYWVSLGHVAYTANGNPAIDFGQNVSVGTGGGFLFAAVASPAGGAGDTLIKREAAGALSFSNNSTIGSRIKVDALPTVASGFGTSPSILAGSTPFAGAVNVGTGGVATSGVINFNGTAFGTAPFIVVTGSLGAVVNIATATTTQLTITASAAWTASTIVSWIAVSPK